MTEGRARYIRFSRSRGQTAEWGLIDGDHIRGLDRAPWLPGLDQTGVEAWAENVQLHAPVEPTKIVALGYNFRELFSDPAAMARAEEPHFSDAGFEPLVFLKAPNTVTGPGQPIRLPPTISEAWIEVEIAAVVRHRARNLATLDQAREAVFGLTIGNDVTALNILGRDWHLARSKSMDTFCPMGPYLLEGWDAEALAMSARINGSLVQDARSDDRVLGTLEAVRFVSHLFTLEAGDVVLTGTPRGARQALVTAGDEVELQVYGLGTLRNPVEAEERSTNDDQVPAGSPLFEAARTN